MLTRENYFSPENEMKYFGSTQFKSFQECESMTMARIRGDYAPEPSTALLVGQYVDSHFEGTLDLFQAQHPEMFKRDGSLKSEFLLAEDVITRMEGDDMFMKYAAGGEEHVPFSVLDHVEAPHDGGVLLGADRVYRRFRHLDHLRTVQNLYPVFRIRILGELRSHLLLDSSQCHFQVGAFLQRLHSSFYNFCGRIVAAHCIYCYMYEFTHHLSHFQHVFTSFPTTTIYQNNILKGMG